MITIADIDAAMDRGVKLYRLNANPASIYTDTAPSIGSFKDLLWVLHSEGGFQYRTEDEVPCVQTTLDTSDGAAEPVTVDATLPKGALVSVHGLALEIKERTP